MVDCVVDHSVRYGAGGDVVHPANETPYTYRTTMVFEAGLWKVGSVELENECER